MKKIIIYFFLIGTIKAQAQSNINWQSILAERGNFSFMLPSQNQMIVDSISSAIYAATIDSAINLEVTYASNFSFDNIPDFDTIAQHQPTETPVLHTMAQYIAFETNGTLVQSEDYAVPNHSGIQAITIGIKYHTIDPSVFTYSFYRFYYWDNKLITFCITSQEEHLNILLSVKQIFFNSVHIN